MIAFKWNKIKKSKPLHFTCHPMRGCKKRDERERESFTSPRTDSASPRYGLLDRITAYMAKTFPAL
jgi:hypothetical protein